jgi:hypothetical protein
MTKAKEKEYTPTQRTIANFFVKLDATFHLAGRLLYYFLVSFLFCGLIISLLLSAIFIFLNHFYFHIDYTWPIIIIAAVSVLANAIYREIEAHEQSKKKDIHELGNFGLIIISKKYKGYLSGDHAKKTYKHPEWRWAIAKITVLAIITFITTDLMSRYGSFKLYLYIVIWLASIYLMVYIISDGLGYRSKWFKREMPYRGGSYYSTEERILHNLEAINRNMR